MQNARKQDEAASGCYDALMSRDGVTSQTTWVDGVAITVTHGLSDEEMAEYDEVPMTIEGIMSLGFTRADAELHVAIHRGEDVYGLAPKVRVLEDMTEEDVMALDPVPETIEGMMSIGYTRAEAEKRLAKDRIFGCMVEVDPKTT